MKTIEELEKEIKNVKIAIAIAVAGILLALLLFAFGYVQTSDLTKMKADILNDEIAQWNNASIHETIRDHEHRILEREERFSALLAYLNLEWHESELGFYTKRTIK